MAEWQVKMGRSPSPDQDKFIVRLPEGMREKIRGAATANGRSMTAEIVARLRQTFDAETAGGKHGTPERNDDKLRLTNGDCEYIAGRIAALLQRDTNGAAE